MFAMDGRNSHIAAIRNLEFQKLFKNTNLKTMIFQKKHDSKKKFSLRVKYISFLKLNPTLSEIAVFAFAKFRLQNKWS